MNSKSWKPVFHKNELSIIHEMIGEKSLHKDNIKIQNANSDSAKTSNFSKKVATKTYNIFVYEEIANNFSVSTFSNKDPYA